MAKFLDPLIVEEISDSIFQTTTIFRYQSDLIGLITVPPLFYTDFASVPRLGIIYALLGDRAHEPAVVHDWLYFSAITTRKISDDVLMEAMQVMNLPWWQRYPIFWGVRIGGWHAWDQHRKDGHPESGKFSTSPDIKV
jgi:hypothetical protein